MRNGWLVGSVCLLVGACASELGSGETTQEVISDQLHGGRAGFFFLPPMVPKPGPYGDFVSTVRPVVRIDQIDPSTGAVQSTLATYTVGKGPGTERVKVHPKNAPGDDGDSDPEGYYIVKWRSADFGLSPANTYRVSVSVPTGRLGYADIDVVTTKKEAKAVNTALYTPLVNGDVLRIKFRIDRPAVDADLDGVLDWADNCPTVANASQTDGNHDGVGDACAANGTIGVNGGTVATPGGGTLTIPYGALSFPRQITVSTAPTPPGLTGVVGPTYKLEPDGLVFSRPIALTLPVPSGTTGKVVFGSRLGAPTTLDPMGSTIAGTSITTHLAHFSTYTIADDPGHVRVTIPAQTTWVTAYLTPARDTRPSEYTVLEAFTQDGGGAYTLPATGSVHAGTGAEEGLVVIESILPGPYLVHVKNTAGGDDKWLYTDTARLPDLGDTRGGRPLDQRTELSASTTLTFKLLGLDSWTDGDSIEFLAPELEMYGFGMPEPDAQHKLPVDLYDNWYGVGGYAIDGSIDDRVVVGQLHQATSSTGQPYYAMTRGAAVPAFNLSSGQSKTETVNLSTIATGNELFVQWDGAQWSSTVVANPDAAPCFNPAVCTGFIGMTAQPGGAEDGQVTATADMMYLDASATTVFDYGRVEYGSPSVFGGTWGSMLQTAYTKQGFLRLPSASHGGGTAIFDGIEMVQSPPANHASITIAPALSAPQSPDIDGRPFFTAGSYVTDTPTLTWSAPAIGTPAYYNVGVRELTIDPATNRTIGKRIATLSTTGTSLTIPPGIMVPTKGYAFVLISVGSTNGGDLTAFADAPFRSRIDAAYGRITSATYASIAGQPTVPTLGPRQRYPFGVATNGTKVCWVERGAARWMPRPGAIGALWCADSDGSNAAPLESNLDQPTALAMDSIWAYWTEEASEADSTLRRRRLDGTGSIETIVNAPNIKGTSIVLAGGELYYQQDWQIHRCTPGSNETDCASSDSVFETRGAVNMASDGTYLYYVDYGDEPAATGRILRKELGNDLAMTDTVAEGLAQPWYVAVDGGYVYWSQSALGTGGAPQEIDRQALGVLDPLNFEIVTVGPADGQNLKVFGVINGNVYYAYQDFLMSVPGTGGTPSRFGYLLDSACPNGTFAPDPTNNELFFPDNCGFRTYGVAVP